MLFRSRALRGEIEHFTGVSDPYEPPRTPEVHLDTEHEGVEESLCELAGYLESARLLPTEQPG